MATKPTFHGKRKLRRLAQIEQQSRLDLTFFEFVKSLVYLIEFSRFANDARSTVRVEFEHLSEVDSGSLKRAHDLDAAEYGFKDRQRHHVVLGQRDQELAVRDVTRSSPGDVSGVSAWRTVSCEGERGRAQKMNLREGLQIEAPRCGTELAAVGLLTLEVDQHRGATESFVREIVKSAVGLGKRIGMHS